MKYLVKVCAALAVLSMSFPVVAFQRAAPETLGFDPAALAQIDKRFSDFVEQGRIPGAAIAILRNGKLAYLKTVGHLTPNAVQPMPQNALFRIYSMTKPIVSLAVLQLIEKGLLKLEDPLHKVLPAFEAVAVWESGRAVAARRPIRIVDLLRHTSGLTYGFFGFGHVRDLYRRAGLLSTRRTNAELAEAIAQMPLEHQPGTIWEYGMSVDVLGRVVEVVSGQGLDSYLQANIFAALGMTDTSFYGPHIAAARVAQGYEQLADVTQPVRFQSGGGGLISSLNDYLLFTQMLLNGGRVGDQQILGTETIELMTRDHLGDRPRGQWDGLGFGYGFGLGVAVRTSARAKWPGSVGDYYWLGYGGTSFWVDPANDMSVVLMMQSVATRDAAARKLRELVYDALTQ